MKDNSLMSKAVLVVDDEAQMLLSAEVMLKGAGIKKVLTLDDGRKVLAVLEEERVGAVVLDLTMPLKTGNELLPEINDRYPHIPVVVMTAVNEVETAVECMKAGAFEYLVKPVEKNLFVSAVKRAMEVNALRRKVDSLKESLLSGRLVHEDAFTSIVTCSNKMRSVFQYCEVIAGTDEPVLITGETGVGKELIARAIHTLSGRRGELIPVNIAGLDDNMFSDTLFGHTKGAFSGADRARDGLIVKASSGTLFLDEIGDLGESAQVKLLRLLQEREYYPLGSDTRKLTDARIIVATNKDLRSMIDEDRFRKDLYYRLRSHHLHIPPLRDRPEDLPLLIDHFLETTAGSLKRKKPSTPPELITLLSTYHFPGNVRELESMIFDAVTRHGGGVLSMDLFRGSINRELSSDNEGRAGEVSSLSSYLGGNGRMPTLKEAENDLIAEALRRAKGNQGIAASYLGITRQALNKRLIRKRS
jgi:DNA-binding NtrC family response regulator